MNSSEAEISYREFVQRYVKAGQLSPDEYDALESYRSHLRLLPATARAIEQEVLAGHATQSSTSTNIPPTELVAPELEPIQFQGQGGVASQPRAGTRSDDQPDPNISDDSTVPPTAFRNPLINALPGSAATTVIPPKYPENYFAHLQQYGQEFLQALRVEGVLLSDETKARLSKLAKQYELGGTDVAEIERKMLVDLYLTSKPPDKPKPPDTNKTPDIVKPIEEIKYSDQLKQQFEELEANLKPGKLRDLRAADIATFQILMKVINPSQPWLDEESLKKFAPKGQDKKAIQELDRLWNHYSQGKFGFSRQLQLYGFDSVPEHAGDLNKLQPANRRHALVFSKRVKWWIGGLEFFKSYNQLDFTGEASGGHLPARWFWKIPRMKAFNYGNLGLLDERGWCRIDPFGLPAFMYMLKNCGITPSKNVTPDTQLSTRDEG